MRAVARYLRQAPIAFSDPLHGAHAGLHPRDRRRCWCGCSRPALTLTAAIAAATQAVTEEIAEAIDAVESLDEDRILRSFLTVVRAMLRTNYYRTDDAGRPLPYLSFKLDPSQVPLLPLPRPRFEIFVYSPRVEGIHLRGGRVARGGLRWSDRREDFRTEVLGLMKAQMVKNALIVPVGSKGGFVRQAPARRGRPRAPRSRRRSPATGRSCAGCST